MNLVTKVNISKFSKDINHKHNLFFIGSCFSDYINLYFKNNKFNTQSNPFGVVYNPVSIEKVISAIATKKRFTKKDLFYENGLWKSFSTHSSLSNTNENDMLSNLNKIVTETFSFLKNTDYLFITLGTSQVYEYKKTNEIVCNCHKLLPSSFNKRMLTTNEIINSIDNIINIVTTINNKVNFIFTVSPVRHFKDDLITNTISKSLLFIGLNEVCKNNNEVYYFPSYEIILDELRDYRYFADDLVHPSSMAVKYIWEIISGTFFSNETIEINKTVESINNAYNHKPFFDNTEEFIKFKQHYYSIVSKTIKKYPFLNLKKEIEYFKNK